MQAKDTGEFIRAEAELIREDARRQKATKIKDLGSPIDLTGQALGIHIRGNDAWIAENSHVIRKLDLETGKTLQLFRGHTAPVTSIAFYDKETGSGKGDILISGSWDKSIKIWDAETKTLLSSTSAHTDFVKALLVIPSLKLLISSGSDKVVRIWDLSNCQDGVSLTSVGTISAHTRPVGCLDARTLSSDEAELFTADTMGLIKVWNLKKSAGDWRITSETELTFHRTRINELRYDVATQQLWTASSDDTVQLHNYPAPPSTATTIRSKPPQPITHPTAVKTVLPLALTPLAEPYLLTGAGDVIRAYDVATPEEPELLGETDAHWHDVTALRLWMRRLTGVDGKVRIEPWIVSASLDGTIRKWKLSELLQPPPPKPATAPPLNKVENSYQMSEEEERELAELMDDDDP